MKKTVKGAMIASAVASLFAMGAAYAGDAAKPAKAEVKCAGVNACKGKGACASAENSCHGQNACKGKGWTMAKSAKDCTKHHGTVVAENKE